MSSFEAAEACPPTAATEKCYLSSTLLFSHSSSVVSLSPSPDPKFGPYLLVMASTIFHPQGGGQPSDVGTVQISPPPSSAASLSCPSGAASCVGSLTFTVTMAKSSGEVVQHFGTISDPSLPEEASLEAFYVGGLAVQSIDADRRLSSARLHSFGHALDAAMSSLGLLSSSLRATKGYHFPDGPHVEYDGVLPPSSSDAALPASLNAALAPLLEADVPTAVSSAAREERAEGGGHPAVVRVVKVAGYDIPCGGTHVPSTAFLKGITVTKVKSKKGVVKIYYDFDKGEEGCKHLVGLMGAMKAGGGEEI